MAPPDRSRAARPAAGCAVAILAFAACADEGVAIDVGHSRAAPGATSARGRVEFEFNRDLALVLESALARRGIATRLVGAAGDQANLGARPVLARGTRLFVSVHHDSVQPHYLQTWSYAGAERAFSDRYQGFSLFVSRKNPALAASLACASRIGEQLRAAGFHPSLYHAEAIAGENRAFADRANGVHYYDNLAVLKGAASSAVLIEAGVIVNREEELRLADPEIRERIAEGVARGISACLPKTHD